MLYIENSLHEPKKGQNVSIDFPDTYINPCWYTSDKDSDYYNLLAFNDKGRALIVEDLTANSAWGSWHLLNGVLQKGEDPILAVQHQLSKITGYRSDNWLYIGSFMLNPAKPDVNGHFFAALGARPTGQAPFFDARTCNLKWVSQKELRYALLDGRIGLMSDAVTASLALLLSPSPTLIPEIE